MSTFAGQNLYDYGEFVQTMPYKEANQLGLYKQQLYDQNIQKIYSGIEQTAALPLTRDVDKQYLQESLNNLQTSLKKLNTADFSRNQVVNSVAGMTSKIAKDKYIQAGVMSTMRHQNEMSLMEEERKKGTLTPDNEWFYQREFSNYANSKEMSAANGTPISFSGRYIKHYDVDKDVQEAIKAAHLDGAEWEEIAKNPDGSVNTDILVEKSKKGLLSPKVANIVNSVFSKPEVQQQLGISGLYSYKDYDVQQLKETQTRTIEYYRKKAKENIDSYKILNQISSKDSGKINSAILNIENELKQKEEEYKQSLQLIEKDPNAFKVNFYKQNKIQEYISNYSWEENSQKSKVNPQFTTAMQRANLTLAQTKEQFDQFDRNRVYNLAVDKFNLDAQEMQIKIAKAKGELNEDGTPKFTYAPQPINTPDVTALGASTYIDETKTLDNERTQLQAELISTLPGFKDLYVKTNEGYRFNYEKYKSWSNVEPLYRKAIVELDKAHLNGTLNPNYQQQVQKFYDLNSLVLQRKDEAAKIEKKYSPVINNVLKEFSTIEGVQNTYDLQIKKSDGLKKYSVSKEDVLKFLTWRNDPIGSSQGQKDASKQAEQYFVDKFGKEGFEDLQTIILANSRKAASQKQDINVGDNKNLWKVYNKIEQLYKKNKTIIPSLNQRDLEYKALQQQNQPYVATYNTGKPEDKININTFYMSQLSPFIKDGKSGEYGKFLEMLDASKPNNLNNNLYQNYKGRDGNWYIRVARNKEDGTMEFSESLKVDYNIIKQLPIKENPADQAFNNFFSPYLNNYRGKQTTSDFTSPEAEVTALMRRPIGKYSVGFHLEELNGGYVPYLYIRDKEGNVLKSGIQADFSVFSKDKRFTPAQRKAFENAQTIIPKESVLQKINSLDENFIELMLNKD